VGLLSKLIPRDEQFFDLFDQLTAHLTQTARMLAELFDDPAHVTDHVRAIKDVEHKADVLTTTINQRIDKSFVTPIDREDIHMLASRLDDVIDLIDGTSRRFEMLHIDVVKEPARRHSRNEARNRAGRTDQAARGRSRRDLSLGGRRSVQGSP
jgi:uncharacterized protein Yka (UPF0111/DUF47 family)